MVVNLLLALENAVGDVSHLRSDSVTYNGLYTVTTECTAGSYCCRHIDYLIVIMRDIGRDIVFEAAFGLVTVT